MRRNFIYIQKIADDIAKGSKYCPHCGHTMYVGKANKVLCDHCRNYIFKDKKAEFNYRFRESYLSERRRNYVKEI